MQRWAEISTATKNQSHQAILFAILNLGSARTPHVPVYAPGSARCPCSNWLQQLRQMGLVGTPGVVAPGSTTSTIRRCSTAQTLPDAESCARGHFLRDAERCTHQLLRQ